MGGGTMVEIERPRSAFELIGATFALYRRYPWLFPILACAVVVPYQVIVLLATGAGPLAAGHVSALTTLLLLAIGSFLITPLISALHVHAVDDVREGREPQIGSVARRGLVTLPIVVAASIISSLGIFLGFVALVVPGVFLLLRWSVVAQAAALMDGSWTDALRRSHELTESNYLHVLGLIFLAGLIAVLPNYLIGLAFGHSTTTTASFLVGTAVGTVTRSFTALATALLFFDLRARVKIAHEVSTNPEPPEYQVPPTGHPLDPGSWSDVDRPAGWYVDPESPWNMRYWAADGAGIWSKRTAKTPKATLAEWKDLRWVREKGDGPEEPA